MASAASLSLPTAGQERAGGKVEPGRLSFIHGLRGVAAMLVVLFHLYEATPVVDHFGGVLPALVDGALRLGFLGVDLFFVISGYVIALTLYQRLAGPADGLRFFARRQLRLDPAYWAAIVASILSAVIVNRLRPESHAPVPSVSDVIAHLFYLQDFLGRKAIVGVFWTLCLEVQFYLFTTVVLLAALRIRLPLRWLVWVLFPVYLTSIAGFWELLPVPPALFVHRWFAFSIGAVLFWYARGEAGPRALAAYLAAPLLVLLWQPRTGNDIAAVSQVTVLLIALLFLLAGMTGGMRHWLSGRVLGYLGTVSYSLYLMHAVIGIRALKLMVHADDGLLRVGLLYAGGVAVSIAAADLLYRLVEKPSLLLSRKVRFGVRTA